LLSLSGEKGLGDTNFEGGRGQTFDQRLRGGEKGRRGICLPGNGEHPRREKMFLTPASQFMKKKKGKKRRQLMFRLCGKKTCDCGMVRSAGSEKEEGSQETKEGISQSSTACLSKKRREGEREGEREDALSPRRARRARGAKRREGKWN